MKKEVYFIASIIVLSISMLVVSCDNIDEPNDTDGGGLSVENIQYSSPSDRFLAWDHENGVVEVPEEYKFRDLARAITALNLDPEICQEVHRAVRKSVESEEARRFAMMRPLQDL